MIKLGNTWHSPYNVYWHIQKLTTEVGAEAIETKNKHRLVREARIGAIIALVMFQKLGKPTYIQLYKPDPPDVILMQPSKRTLGQIDITLLEITTYIKQKRESLLEQLKRTKTKPGIHTLSENYILIVNVGVSIRIDYEPIRDYLNKNHTPFPIWTLQQVSNYPDTIARVVIINPKIHSMDVNVGEAAFTFRGLRFPDIVRTRRVGKVKYVRVEKAGKCNDAPWETIGK